MPQKNAYVNFSFGTQAEYNALSTKDENTFYILTDTQKIYVGNKIYTSKISIENLDGSFLSAFDPSPNEEGMVPIINQNGQLSSSGFMLNATVPANAVFTDTTYQVATDSTDGLMSAEDKIKLDSIDDSSSEGTVTNISTGIGLAGGTITSSGTIKAKLKSETALLQQASLNETANKTYAVVTDSDGYLAVNVPWTDTNTTYSNATQDTNGLMSAADKIKLDNLPSNIVYLSHAEYNELTQPDPNTLYIFTDGGSSEGTSMVQQINRYIPRRLMKQHIDEAEIGQATEEVIKTPILSEQGRNISNWTKNISPLPQFTNVYNNGNNNLTYVGGGGHERIYFPITIENKGVRFEFDYKTSTGFNCMYGSNEDYAFISLVAPTEITGLKDMGSRVPVKVALSSTASNTTNHYCLDYWNTSGSVVYIGFDFGYIEDGVQTIFDFNNIECSEIDLDIEIVITPST